MLVKFLFADFRRKFKVFFDMCEQGFINEAIINLYTRRWEYDVRTQMVHRTNIKMSEMFFVV